MPTTESKSEARAALEDKLGNAQGIAAEVTPKRAGFRAFVVVMAVSKSEWWIHRYEVEAKLVAETVPRSMLQDYERKSATTLAAALQTAEEWASGLAGFDHIVKSDAPYPG